MALCGAQEFRRGNRLKCLPRLGSSLLFVEYLMSQVRGLGFKGKRARRPNYLKFLASSSTAQLAFLPTEPSTVDI